MRHLLPEKALNVNIDLNLVSTEMLYFLKEGIEVELEMRKEGSDERDDRL